MFGLNETRYGTKDLIAWDVNGGVEDITLHNLLVEVGLLDEDHEYEELTVVWEYLDQEIHIQEIYDNDSGDVLWRLPEDEAYSEEDDVITFPGTPHSTILPKKGFRTSLVTTYLGGYTRGEHVHRGEVIIDMSVNV